MVNDGVGIKIGVVTKIERERVGVPHENIAKRRKGLTELKRQRIRL